MRKITFVQNFGLQENGGGARILRTLLKDAPFRVVSICSQGWPPKPVTMANVLQHWSPLRKACFLDRTRFGRFLQVADVAFAYRHRRNIIKKLKELSPDAVHVVPHSEYDWQAAMDYCVGANKPIVCSMHDDLRYTLGKRYLCAEAQLRDLWKRSAEVCCISEELGEEYCKRFGLRSYHVLTDAVDIVNDVPKSPLPGRLHIYFCGLLHHSYIENLRSLLKALSEIQQSGTTDVKLILRGCIPFKELAEFKHLIETLPFQDDVFSDFIHVDMLYLPLPFAVEHRDFVRFSLSTKFVTYVASGVPILFHGPPDSALGQLLRRTGSAVINDTMEIGRKSLLLDETAVGTCITAAKALAVTRFNSELIRNHFFQILANTIDS